MAIVTLAEAKDFMRVDHAEEDALILRLVDGAQNQIERHLGYKIEATFGGVDQDPVPPALYEAVCQLAAWWYETRGPVSEEAREMPYGVREIVDGYRDWTF